MAKEQNLILSLEERSTNLAQKTTEHRKHQILKDCSLVPWLTINLPSECCWYRACDVSEGIDHHISSREATSIMAALIFYVCHHFFGKVKDILDPILLVRSNFSLQFFLVQVM